jgi:hypothetical protein
LPRVLDWKPGRAGNRRRDAPARAGDSEFAGLWRTAPRRGGGADLSAAGWISIFPGIGIMVTVLGINFLGGGLRDLLDPRLRREM